MIQVLIQFDPITGSLNLEAPGDVVLVIAALELAKAQILFRVMTADQNSRIVTPAGGGR